MKRLLVILVAAVALCTGCTRVLFLGDSVTVIASPALKDKMADVYIVSDVVATVAIDTEQLVDKAKTVNIARYDAVIVNIGTNDVGGDHTDWQTHYDELLGMIDDRTCVVLTTVNVFADLINPPVVVPAEDVNAYIVGQVDAHPTNFRLVDWNAQTAVHEYTTDGIHPNPAGAAWLAGADLAALRSCGL